VKRDMNTLFEIVAIGIAWIVACFTWFWLRDVFGRIFRTERWQKAQLAEMQAMELHRRLRHEENRRQVSEALMASWTEQWKVAQERRKS
jgi:5-carboxymethyl-2-hydroxymuconate isomerase